VGKRKPHACTSVEGCFSLFRAEGVFSFVPRLQFSLSLVTQTDAQQTEAAPGSSFYNYVANSNLAMHTAVFVLFPKYGIVPFGYLGQISNDKLTAKWKSRRIIVYLYSRD